VQCGKHGRPANGVEKIGRLIHLLAFELNSLCIWFGSRASIDVVIAVDGAGFLTMQMSAVAGEGDEVSHVRAFTAPYSRGSEECRCATPKLSSCRKLIRT
jgi:hypothetical protein